MVLSLARSPAVQPLLSPHRGGRTARASSLTPSSVSPCYRFFLTCIILIADSRIICILKMDQITLPVHLTSRRLRGPTDSPYNGSVCASSSPRRLSLTLYLPRRSRGSPFPGIYPNTVLAHAPRSAWSTLNPLSYQIRCDLQAQMKSRCPPMPFRAPRASLPPASPSRPAPGHSRHVLCLPDFLDHFPLGMRPLRTGTPIVFMIVRLAAAQNGH